MDINTEHNALQLPSSPGAVNVTIPETTLATRTWWTWATRGQPTPAAQSSSVQDRAQSISGSPSGPLEDFSDLDKLEFLQTGCCDRTGRNLLIIVSKNYPAKMLRTDRVSRYLRHKVDDISSAPYSILWYHTTSSYWENCPSMRWMWQTYESLPCQYRDNLCRVYMVHCDLSLWCAMMAVCPWLTSAFWQKVEWVSRVEFLWDELDKRKTPVPVFVAEHDRVLEDAPLLDYGLIASKDAMGPTPM